MISDAIALLELIHRIYRGRKIISALFDWEGKRLEGNERLKIDVHSEDATRWYYSVEPFEDYQFIRIPVNAGAVVESLGTIAGESNPRAEYFRYIPVPDGRIRGGEPTNVKVNFMVIAYKPSDILSTAES